MPSPPSWRKRFGSALKERSFERLESLVAEYHSNPTISHQLDEVDASASPLAIAAGIPSVWAVQALLGLGEVPTLPAVKNLLRQIKGSPADWPKIQAVFQKAWAPFLPHVLANPLLCQDSLVAFLRHGWGDMQVLCSIWQEAGLDDLVKTVGHAPIYIAEFDARFTPLQVAWLENSPFQVEKLLDLGAEASTPSPHSGLPTWTLEEALETMQNASAQRLDSDECSALARSRWPTSNPEVTFHLKYAASWWDGQEAWEGVWKKTRCQSLDSTLPTATAPKRGPRF